MKILDKNYNHHAVFAESQPSMPTSSANFDETEFSTQIGTEEIQLENI